jgi:hypothetical protein
MLAIGSPCLGVCTHCDPIMCARKTSWLGHRRCAGGARTCCRAGASPCCCSASWESVLHSWACPYDSSRTWRKRAHNVRRTRVARAAAGRHRQPHELLDAWSRPSCLVGRGRWGSACYFDRDQNSGRNEQTHRGISDTSGGSYLDMKNPGRNEQKHRGISATSVGSYAGDCAEAMPVPSDRRAPSPGPRPPRSSRPGAPAPPASAAHPAPRRSAAAHPQVPDTSDPPGLDLGTPTGEEGRHPPRANV